MLSRIGFMGISLICHMPITGTVFPMSPRYITEVNPYLPGITGSVLMIIFQDRQSINGNVNETSNELQ